MGGCCSDTEDKVRSYVTDDFVLLPQTDVGEPLSYDQSFKGPQAKRSCTDLPCLLIFLCFLGSWGYIAHYAITNGDLNKLLVPTDSQNRKCGVDSQVIDKKYLFFFNLEKCIDPLVPITGCPTPQTCVSSCPSETFVWDTMKDKLSLEQIKEKLICQTDLDKSRIKNLRDVQIAIDENRCARWYVKSAPFSKRCIPSDTEGVKQVMKEIRLPPSIIKIVERMQIADYDALGQEIVEDVINSWFIIFVALIVTMVVSLIFIALMRWIAGPVLWFSIIGVLAALGAGIYYSAKEYAFWKNTPTVPNHSINIGSTVKNVFQQANTWLYTSISLAIIFVIIFLVVIFLRKRIVIAIALVKEGSKAVSTVISTVFFPIFPWMLYIGTIAFTVAVGLYLASIGQSSFKVIKPINSNQGEECTCTGPAIGYSLGSACDPIVFQQHCFALKSESTVLQFFGGEKAPCSQTGCYFEKIENPKLVSYFQGLNIFGFFWLAFFISALGDMVLAATFATWYWTFHKSDVPYFTLTHAFGRTVRYHLGTLALGALILTICRIIRLILEYIDEKLKKYDNAFTRAILCCMKCFFWCLESFLRFLNRNAYIMCAIHGKNFCTSARDAFNLLMRNFLRVVTLDKVTDFLFFLSKILLTTAAGVATYSYLEYYSVAQRLNYNAVPTTIVVIGTFLITSVFFGVYSMAVDTLFLCFLEDCERNDGSAEKPYFMSKNLMKILGKHNIVPKHQYR